MHCSIFIAGRLLVSLTNQYKKCIILSRTNNKKNDPSEEKMTTRDAMPISNDSLEEQIQATDILPSDAINYGRSLYRATQSRNKNVQASSQRYVEWFENIAERAFQSKTPQRLYLQRLSEAGANLAEAIRSRKDRLDREVRNAHTELDLIKKLARVSAMIGNVSKVAFHALVLGGLFLLLFDRFLGLPDFWQPKNPGEPNYKLILTLMGTCLVGVALKIYSTSRYQSRFIQIRRLEDAALRRYRRSVRHEHDRCKMKALKAWKVLTGEDYSDIKLFREGIAVEFHEEEFMPNDLTNDKAIHCLRMIHLCIHALRLIWHKGRKR